jgi:nucleoside-diphosphate-sugar epimerase
MVGLHAKSSWPADVYGWTKLTGEQLAQQANTTGMIVHVVRPFSGYGEDQSLNFPFRAFVERALNRENPFTIWGDSSQVRDWIHIDDVVQGILQIVEDDVRVPVNLCTGVGTSMYQLAMKMCEYLGATPEIKVDRDAPLGVHYRVGDPTRFHRHYVPRITIDEGVRRALRK